MAVYGQGSSSWNGILHIARKYMFYLLYYTESMD